MLKCTKFMGVTYVLLGILQLLNLRDDKKNTRGIEDKE